MADDRKCPVCGKTYAREYIKESCSQVWVPTSVAHGTVFFCSATCRDGFLAWPDAQQLYAVFGSVGSAGWAMQRAAYNRRQRDHRTPAVAIASELPVMTEAGEACRWSKAEDGQVAGDDRPAVEIIWRDL